MTSKVNMPKLAPIEDITGDPGLRVALTTEREYHEELYKKYENLLEERDLVLEGVAKRVGILELRSELKGIQTDFFDLHKQTHGRNCRALLEANNVFLSSGAATNYPPFVRGDLASGDLIIEFTGLNGSSGVLDTSSLELFRNVTEAAMNVVPESVKIKFDIAKESTHGIESLIVCLLSCLWNINSTEFVWWDIRAHPSNFDGNLMNSVDSSMFFNTVRNVHITLVEGEGHLGKDIRSKFINAFFPYYYRDRKLYPNLTEIVVKGLRPGNVDVLQSRIGQFSIDSSPLALFTKRFPKLMMVHFCMAHIEEEEETSGNMSKLDEDNLIAVDNGFILEMARFQTLVQNSRERFNAEMFLDSENPAEQEMLWKANLASSS